MGLIIPPKQKIYQGTYKDDLHDLLYEIFETEFEYLRHGKLSMGKEIILNRLGDDSERQLLLGILDHSNIGLNSEFYTKVIGSEKEYGIINVNKILIPKYLEDFFPFPIYNCIFTLVGPAPFVEIQSEILEDKFRRLTGRELPICEENEFDMTKELRGFLGLYGLFLQHFSTGGSKEDLELNILDFLKQY